MGYSEVLCHICGVSFNIGRIRRPDEPRSAAWSRFGPVVSHVRAIDVEKPAPYMGYVDGVWNSWTGKCPRDAGCMFVMRKIKDEGREVVITSRGRRWLKPGPNDKESSTKAYNGFHMSDELGANLETQEEDDDDAPSEEGEDVSGNGDGDTDGDDEADGKDLIEDVDEVDSDAGNKTGGNHEMTDFDYGDKREAFGDSSLYKIEGNDESDEDCEVYTEEDDEPLEYASDIDEKSDVEMEDADYTHLKRKSEEFKPREYRKMWIENLVRMKIPKKDRFSRNNNLPAWFNGVSVVEAVEEVQDDMFPIYYPAEDPTTDYGTDGSMDSDTSRLSEDALNDAKLNHRVGGKLGYFLKQQYDVEHIAGPGCLNRCGYSGHEISVEEMRGCQISQCLVQKPTKLDDEHERMDLQDADGNAQVWNFQPSEDDEEFEKHGKFFLSGLSEYMPSRDSAFPRVKPARHQCTQPEAENNIWEDDRIEHYAMPFHPACFEVYKRASLRDQGGIDVDGLMGWWLKDALLDSDKQLSHGSEVAGQNEQEWSHWNGSAYVVANPLFVPKLRDILHAATQIPPDFNPRNSAFPIHNYSHSVQDTDCFAVFPVELQMQILDHLQSKDIAALRRCSRTFHQISTSYFQKIINREMPWLWEAWPTNAAPNSTPPYSYWATTTPDEAERRLQEPLRQVAALNDYVNIVSFEMPDLKSMLEDALPGEIQAVLDAHRLQMKDEPDCKPFFLPPDRTDYYLLYTLLTRHWADLKGLKNRKRIWKDCRRILYQIRWLRERGRIDS